MGYSVSKWVIVAHLIIVSLHVPHPWFRNMNFWIFSLEKVCGWVGGNEEHEWEQALAERDLELDNSVFYDIINFKTLPSTIWLF